MRKVIKRVGSSLGIIISKEERVIYDIKLGDVVDVKIKKLEDNK